MLELKLKMEKLLVLCPHLTTIHSNEVIQKTGQEKYGTQVWNNYGITTTTWMWAFFHFMPGIDDMGTDWGYCGLVIEKLLGLEESADIMMGDWRAEWEVSDIAILCKILDGSDVAGVELSLPGAVI